MSVDVRKEQGRSHKDKVEEELDETTEDTPPKPPLAERSRIALAKVDWRQVVVVALLMASGWCLLFLSNQLMILSGVVPVIAGLYMGRRVKDQYLLHGMLVGLIGFVVGLIIVSVYAGLMGAGIAPPYIVPQPEGLPAEVATPSRLILIYLSFSAIALVPFPAFGTVMAGRSEQRNRELRQQVEERGGRLERPGSVRTLEDLQGLSLPQLGTYVSNLFKKNGFQFLDYRFIDKDKHLDLEMAYQEEAYLIRLSVADKVRPGTIESLSQDMRRREIKKGLVITSTEFTSDTAKLTKGRANIVLVDGQKLFDMAES